MPTSASGTGSWFPGLFFFFLDGRAAGTQGSARVEISKQPPEEKRLWRHMKLVAKLPERDQRAVLCLIDTAARPGRSA